MKHYIKGEYKRIALFYIFSTIGSCFFLITGVLMGKIVDVAIETDIQHVIWYTFLTIVFICLLFLMNALEKKSKQEYLMRVGNNIRHDIVQGLLKMPMKSYKENSADYYFNVINGDVDMIMDYYLDSMIMVLREVVATCLFAGILFFIHPLLLLISLALALIPVLASRWMIAPNERINHEKSEANETYLSHLHETIYGLDVIKRSQKNQIFLDRFRTALDHVGDKINQMEIYRQLTQRAMWSINSFVQVVITAACSIFILRGEMSPGTLVSSMALVNFFSESLTNACTQFTYLRASTDVSDKALALAAWREKATESEDGDMDLIASIECDQLSFSYGDRPLFSELTFSMQDRECNAIIGKSGSGKTTLINLLLKSLDGYTGTIRVMGRDLKDISETEWYRHAFLIPQEVYIFNSSIFDNVSLFDAPTGPNTARVKEILNQLGIIYLLNKDHLQEDVATQGLSGGEKKRIAIARALYQNCQILIFDEPTAGLDPPQAKKINELIFSMTDHLRLVVTHNWNKDYLSRFDQLIELQR